MPAEARARFNTLGFPLSLQKRISSSSHSEIWENLPPPQAPLRAITSPLTRTESAHYKRKLVHKPQVNIHPTISWTVSPLPQFPILQCESLTDDCPFNPVPLFPLLHSFLVVHGHQRPRIQGCIQVGLPPAPGREDWLSDASAAASAVAW